MQTNAESYLAWLETLPGKQKALLKLLGDYKYHTQQEMLESVGWRFSAVVETLRKKDFDIHSNHIEGTVWEYKLVSVPKPKAA